MVPPKITFENDHLLARAVQPKASGQLHDLVRPLKAAAVEILFHISGAAITLTSGQLSVINGHLKGGKPTPASRAPSSQPRGAGNWPFSGHLNDD
jgi:hypothetical protein